MGGQSPRSALQQPAPPLQLVSVATPHCICSFLCRPSCVVVDHLCHCQCTLSVACVAEMAHVSVTNRPIQPQMWCHPQPASWPMCSCRLCSSHSLSPSPFTFLLFLSSISSILLHPTPPPCDLCLPHPSMCALTSSNGDIRSWDLRKTQSVGTFHTMNALYMCEAHPSVPLLAWYVFQQPSWLSLALNTSQCINVSTHWLVQHAGCG